MEAIIEVMVDRGYFVSAILMIILGMLIKAHHQMTKRNTALHARVVSKVEDTVGTMKEYATLYSVQTTTNNDLIRRVEIFMKENQIELKNLVGVIRINEISEAHDKEFQKKLKKQQ